MRVRITLACDECKQRNYNTMKNKKNDPDRLEMMKYCRFCKKETLHKETKQERGKKMANTNTATPKKKNKIVELFSGVKTELKKVVWPTKKETYKYTVVVLVVCAAFALLFYILDTGVLALLRLILNLTM